MRGYGMARGGLHIYPTAVHASVGPGVLPCPGQVGGGGSAMRGYGMARGGLHIYPTAVTPRQARGSFRARARGGCTRTERDALRYTHWGGWDEVAG